MVRLRNGLRAAVAATVLATGIVVAAPAAYAACGHAQQGQVMTICAQDLSLRTNCYDKAWMGFLYRGDRFRVDIDYGSWVYGYSYRHNRSGCVQDGWFM